VSTSSKKPRGKQVASISAYFMLGIFFGSEGAGVIFLQNVG
jgi:hypothetical protein